MRYAVGILMVVLVGCKGGSVEDAATTFSAEEEPADESSVVVTPPCGFETMVRNAASDALRLSGDYYRSEIYSTIRLDLSIYEDDTAYYRLWDRYGTPSEAFLGGSVDTIEITSDCILNIYDQTTGLLRFRLENPTLDSNNRLRYVDFFDADTSTQIIQQSITIEPNPRW